MSESYLTLIEGSRLIQLSGLRRYRDSAIARHRLVMSLFPQGLGDNPRAAAGVLFRVERTRRGVVFLIRSTIAPAALPQLETVKESIDGFHSGDKVVFRWTANAVKRIEQKERYLIDFDELEEWAKQRLSPALEAIELVNTIDESLVRDHANVKGPKFRLTRIDGVATVKNVEALNSLLTDGVGRGKSYGAGLLTVKKIGE